MPQDLHILTGAPGSGKTAILDTIGADIRCVGEPAREILAEQRAIDGDGTSDRNASLFVDLLLQRSIDKHWPLGPEMHPCCSIGAYRTASPTRP